MANNLLQEEPYRTPAGCIDFPFAYVYNASSLTDGSNYQQVQVPLQGDSDFILRHIAGVPTVISASASGGFNYQNASRSYTQSAKSQYPNNWPVVPEKRYPRNGSIYIDLFDVDRSGTAGPGETAIYYSFIAFFGVKRYVLAQGGGGIVQQVTPYRYREKRYSYEYALTISQGHYVGVTATPNPASRYVIPLDNFDFELLQIAISKSGEEGGLAFEDFQIQLYDPTMHMLSSAPLNQGFINSARAASGARPAYQGVMPVPGIVYPAGGNLVFDITSMLPNANTPQTYALSFQGVWRIPC